MKQNDNNIKLLIRQPKYSILIICLFLSSISGLSQTQTVVLNYDFNNSNNLSSELGTNSHDYDLLPPSLLIAPLTTNHESIQHHMIKFREPLSAGLENVNGYVTSNSNKMADIFNLNHGYTIITRVLIDDTFDDDYRKKIFRLLDNNGNTIFGLERYKQQLVFDRYLVPPGTTTKSTWKFDLWDPVQFSLNSSPGEFQPYYIAISVTKNLFRVKVFEPGYDASAYAKTTNNPNGNNCGRCELVYLGGQVLLNSEIASFGFGGKAPDKSIFAMDLFRVYSGAMSFADIDTQYNTDLANNFAKSGNGKTKETLGLTPEESVFAMHIYPNPTSGKFTLNFTLLNQDKIDYNLYSLDGKEVLTNTGQVFGSGIHNLEIDASHLASGIYFLNVKSGEHLTKIYKIIIE
jgi:hypothetical protein